MTLMCAVDGSPPSLEGAQFAAKLAMALEATLELVYVSFPILLNPAVYAKAFAQIDEADAAHAKRVLAEATQSLLSSGVHLTTRTQSGAPAEELAKLAERPEVWGLVVGATGHSTASRWLLGSVADRLVHICPKPVVVVRNSTPEKHP
jgi:nucleotide-binding universal stress UspA family protein